MGCDGGRDNEEQEKEFSPAKGRRRTTKHQLTPSPQDKRNVKQKTDENTSDEDSDKDDAVDDELREKFKLYDQVQPSEITSTNTK